MIRRFILFFCISITVLYCQAATILLPELNKPDFLRIQGERLYLAEGAVIFIYDLKKGTLVKTFGREGEGPKEFKGEIHLIDVTPDYLQIASM